jgi:imidazolonepropionase-like amidohydrolase
MKALTGAVIYTAPHRPPIRGKALLMDGDTIVAIDAQVPTDAEIIDCTNCTITAAFTNSHVHFFERKWANAASIPDAELQRQVDEFLTRYGFVSAFDLSSQLENTRVIRDRIHNLRIRTTGEGLLPPGGAAPDLAYAIMGLTKTPLFEPVDARAATDVVRKLIDDGVDGIKLFLSGPNGVAMDRAVIEAAVDTAHRANKPVFAHPNTAADVMTAIQTGVDILAHTTPRSPWTDVAIPPHMAITPTLWLWKFYGRHDRASLQDQSRAAAASQLRAWRDAGASVLFGTDLGAVDPDPTEEYRLMQEAGMSFDDILESLTTAPASRFGDGSGRLEVGARAKLVVLRGDPAKDIAALDDVKLIV